MATRVGRLTVGLALPDGEVPVGTLGWSRADRLAAFEYDPGFAARRLEISPLHLPVGPGVRMAPRQPFGGLHGVFADSLPDGWGRLLVDRLVAARGDDPRSLGPLDRLAMVGTRGMGALVYRPETMVPRGAEGVDIDALAALAAEVRDGVSDDVEVLLGANGGSAGARAKILVLRHRTTGAMRLDHGQAPMPDEQAWLVKFPAREDPQDMGRIEHAFALMARAAGVDFPPTMLIHGRSGRAYFAALRFDRENGARRHVHSLAGLVHADFRAPSVDYDGLLKATRLVTGQAPSVEEALRRMVLNVMAGNRDDHAKNHSFLLGSDGAWRLSPAYDVTPSEGLGGEHSMAVAGEGRAPGRAHVLEVAKRASIKPRLAESIVGEVAEAVSAWPDFAEQAGLGDREATVIARAIEASVGRLLTTR